MFVTFPEEDTHPLGFNATEKPSIISEYFGIDYAEGPDTCVVTEVKKTCVFAGCPSPYTMRPPCALCYE